MRRTYWFVPVIAFVLTASAQAQVGSPGVDYGQTIAAGDGVQLYPYDQQDPWLHGHFQRVPSYGGYSSFRPYNYRHVLAQTQLAQSWGHAHGMPYSQQFWNRYRGSYLEGNLHATTGSASRNPQTPVNAAQAELAHTGPVLIYPTQGVQFQGFPNQAFPASDVNPIGYETQGTFEGSVTESAESAPRFAPVERPVHIFPERMNNR